MAPVSYLQFSSTPKLYTATRAPLLAFPLGMALTLAVRFFDSVGVKFHAQNNQLHLALNRYVIPLPPPPVGEAGSRGRFMDTSGKQLGGGGVE